MKRVIALCLIVCLSFSSVANAVILQRIRLGVKWKTLIARGVFCVGIFGVLALGVAINNKDKEKKKTLRKMAIAVWRSFLQQTAMT